ncbi:Small RNA 2'-O-methyltransferase [Linnemannia zychae]|nr:Small RNA 2'-O-methyltransferase [Linnemannia zychae]
MYFPSTTNSTDSLTADSACDTNDEPRFFPPLWQQRRNLTRRILEENNVTSVIDFGCGEAALMSLLIWETLGDYPITRLAGVELKEDRLQLALDACQPQDFELGSNLRVNELTIDFYQGSVDQPDQRLVGFDALACLEVVEHLDPPVLEKFWSVVLGVLKPRIVIVSTPNAEFNIYFPQLNYGTPRSVFRNDDHRFEWTRQEFQDWCDAAAEEYGYGVTYTGVGALPGYNPEVGLCTQFAILHIHNPPKQPSPTRPTSSDSNSLPYKHFSRIEYPIYKETHTDENILEYLHDKIACIRPRPPQSKDDTDNLKYFDIATHGEESSNNNNYSSTDLESNTSIIHKPSNDPPIELGVVLLEDIWIILAVRQRCKTKSNMIRILGLSSLVKVDQEADIVRFDEDNPYWKEFDRLNDAHYSLSENESVKKYDNGDWSDPDFYNDDQDYFEEVDPDRKPYGLSYQDYVDQEEQFDDSSAREDNHEWSAWNEPPRTSECSEYPSDWDSS